MKFVRLTQDHPPAHPPDNYYFWLRSDRITTICKLGLVERGKEVRFRTAVGDRIGKTWYVMETPEQVAEILNQALGGGVKQGEKGSD